MDTTRIPQQALQYKPKGRRNIWRPRKRWRDQFHSEDQGRENTPNPLWTWWWWWWWEATYQNSDMFRSILFICKDLSNINKAHKNMGGSLKILIFVHKKFAYIIKFFVLFGVRWLSSTYFVTPDGGVSFVYILFWCIYNGYIVCLFDINTLRTG
jgi:hypothetical protein